MSLSRHFTLEELVASETAARRGLDNTPTTEIVAALANTAQGLERVRAAVGGLPIHVNSGYRSAKVNAAVGGSANSQHCKGEAADIICPAFGPPFSVAQEIAAHEAEIGFDQCILEFGAWVHVSFTESPRGNVLTINRDGTFKGLVA